MLTVLVADDSDDNRDILAELLQDEGYRVLQAQTAAETLSLCRAEPPDVVLMDIQMPLERADDAVDSNAGLDVTRALRADAATRDLPVVLLSGQDEAAVGAAVATVGADACCRKPYDFPHLLATIAGLLDGR